MIYDEWVSVTNEKKNYKRISTKQISSKLNFKRGPFPNIDLKLVTDELRVVRNSKDIQIH